MKRISFLLTGVIVLLLAFSACTDGLPEVRNSTLKQIVMTAADFEMEEGSRTDFHITSSGAEFSWAANDTVGIFPNEGAQAYFPMVSGAGTKTAKFDGGGWALKDASVYAAYYPFIGDIYLDRSAIPVNYEGQMQTGNESTTHLGAYDFMAAVPASPSSGSVNFAFKHLGALVQLQLTLPEPTTVHSVSLMTDSGVFITKGKVDIMSSNPCITPISKSKNLSLAVKDITTTEANQVITLYLMIPPTDLSGKTLKAVVNCSNGSKEATLSSKNFLAGKAYALVGTLAEIQDMGMYDAVIGEHTEIIDDVFASYVTNTVDGSTIVMAASTPAELLPKTGQVLLCGVEDENFPYGFMGKVRQVLQDANGYVVETQEAEIEDIFESINVTGEMDMEIVPQMESRSTGKKLFNKTEEGLDLTAWGYHDKQGFQGISMDMALDLNKKGEVQSGDYMEGSFGAKAQIHYGIDIGFRCSYNISENIEGQPDCFDLYLDILKNNECDVALDFEGGMDFNHKLAELEFSPLKLKLGNCIKKGKDDSRAIQAVVQVVFAILRPKLEVNYKTSVFGKIGTKLNYTKSTITKLSIENSRYDINTIEGGGDGLHFTNLELKGEAKTGVDFKFSMYPFWNNKELVELDFYAGPQVTGTAEYGDDTENNAYFDIVPLDMTLNGKLAVYPILKNTHEAILKASFEKNWRLGEHRRWLFPRFDELNAYFDSGNSQKIIVSALLKDTTLLPVNVGFSLYDADDNYIKNIQTLQEYNFPSPDDGTYLEDEFINIDKSKIYYVKPNVELLGIANDYTQHVLVGSTALREALIKLYQSTNGDKWTRNDNWCSDRPVTEWYGVESLDTLHYCDINLSDNNLTGKIEQTFPNSISFYVICSGNQITSIDVSGSTSLIGIHFDNNPLTSVDLSRCTGLGIIGPNPICYFHLSGCQLESLNLSGCTQFTHLVIDNCNVGTLNLSGCTALATLDVFSYSFGTLDISGCTALEGLVLDHGSDIIEKQLSALKAFDCIALKNLSCINVQLTSLNLKNCIALEDLNCSNNQLTSLDLSSYTSLRNLDCSDNRLRTLDISGCMALEGLSCGRNQLTSLDLSNRITLKYIYCDDNRLRTLDISGCMALEGLFCSRNQLTSLDLSNRITLKYIYCDDNLLRSLDVSGCMALEHLVCFNNQLKSLNLSSSSALKILDCLNNQIKSEIPDWFSHYGYLYDVRYEYLGWEQNQSGEWIPKYKDNGVGWWYPGEPEKGYHGR